MCHKGEEEERRSSAQQVEKVPESEFPAKLHKQNHGEEEADEVVGRDSNSMKKLRMQQNRQLDSTVPRNQYEGSHREHSLLG